MTGRLHLHRGLSALIEVIILFLPAIPAYLWMWPNLEGLLLRIADIATHLYVLAGTLFIGLRRWNLDQLGVNAKGVWLSLAFGAAVILGRSLVILSTSWGLPPPQYNLAALAGKFLYYFALIGLVQELLFRGLVYRAFEEWLGTRWAIWGSSVGFVLWHVFGGGLLIGLAMLLYGLIFALVRWRAGGIIGLILVHGAIDFAGALMLPDLDVLSLGRPTIPYPPVMLIGLALILLTPAALWQLELLAKLFHLKQPVN